MSPFCTPTVKSNVFVLKSNQHNDTHWFYAGMIGLRILPLKNDVIQNVQQGQSSKYTHPHGQHALF
jgi:hypothetical protein